MSLYDGTSQATGADTTVPTAATFSASTSVGETSFNLNWLAASDNGTTAAALQYFVCSGVSAAAIDTAAECLAATQELGWTANTTGLAITGKSPASTYYYNVVVRDPAGNQAIYPGQTQATIADAVAPTAATFSASTSVTETAFNLVWAAASDNVTAAASLEYFVCSGANTAAIDSAAECVAATQELNWTANTTGLAITGKSPATTYYYNVVVRDAAGNQAIYPGQTQATIADVVVPTAGTFSASTSVTETAFNLVWTAGSDNVTAAASLEYFVCSGANAAAIDTVAECEAATQEMGWTANTTTRAISGKSPATTYYYNVVVRDAAGNQSIFPGKTQATIADVVVPTAGTFSASTSVTETAFNLVWTAASDNVTAAATLEYFVCSGASAAVIDTVAECLAATQEMGWIANTTTRAISGKSPATTYYYNVIVRDAAGNQSVYPSKSQTTIGDIVVPIAGTFSTSTSITETGFNLLWTAASDNVTAAANLQYLVCSGASAAAIDTAAECLAATQELNWSANTTGLAITGKNPATTYYYNVVVRDAAGNQSVYPGKSQATIADVVLPTAGTFSASTSVTETSFNLIWTAASDNVTAAASLQYFVCSGASAAALDTAAECVAATQAMTWTANTTTLAISGKSPATTYYYNVVVRDAAGNQAVYPGKSQATIADVVLPTAGTFSASTSVTETAFNLVWTAGSDNVTAAASLEYFVCSGANAAAIDTSAECLAATQEMGWIANTTTRAISGKSPATTYYYNIVVRDAAGNQSIFPGKTQATIADVVLPTAGTFSASTSVTETAFNLVWTAASDNITAAASLQYFVCSGANAAAIDTAAECLAATQELNWTANTTGLAITGKSPATTYYYNVVVRDAAGNQSVYPGKSQATIADAVVPTAGTFSASTSVTETSFNLIWTAASDNITAAASLQYFVCSGANAAAIDTAAECIAATQEMAWTANTTTRAISGKSPATTYYYNVVVRDAAGNQSIYPVKTQATIADATAPTAGAFTTTTIVTSNRYMLHWTAASDNVTTAVNLQYYVCRGASTAAIDTVGECLAATQQMNWTANILDTNPIALSPNTTYYFNVVVRDQAGNQSIYNGKSDTTNGQTLNINSGAAQTNNTSVTLTLDVTAATQMYVSNTAGCASGGAWEAYASSKAWTLSTANATNTVYAAFRDAAGWSSDCVSDTIVHDNVAPTGQSLSISSGATYTTSSSVTLGLAATAATEMLITNNADCTTGTWEAYAATKAGWTLGQSNGVATVYARFRDAAGNLSVCASDTITHDSLGPSSTTISINAASSYTTTTSVTLTLAASDASQMYVTNTSGCGSGGSWEAYATSKAWTLGQSNATATVYIKYQDVAGNVSSCINDTIIHDTQPPTATSISIAAGATYAPTTAVTLTLAATDVNQMYVTNTSGCGSGGSWESYGTSKAWTLAQSEATATVYVKYRDSAGNASACISDTIVQTVGSLVCMTSYASGAVDTSMILGFNTTYPTNATAWIIYGPSTGLINQYPQGLAFDAAHNQLVSTDWGNHLTVFNANLWAAGASFSGTQDIAPVVQTSPGWNTIGVTYDTLRDVFLAIDTNNSRVFVNSYSRDGNMTPTVRRDFNVGGTLRSIFYEPVHNEIIIAKAGDNSVYFYSAPSTGLTSQTAYDSPFTLTLLRTITGASTGLSGPEKVTYDSVNGKVLIANSGGHNILAYTYPTGSGSLNIAPTYTITDSSAKLVTPRGITLNTNRTTNGSTQILVSTNPTTGNKGILFFTLPGAGATGSQSLTPVAEIFNLNISDWYNSLIMCR